MRRISTIVARSVFLAALLSGYFLFKSSAPQLQAGRKISCHALHEAVIPDHAPTCRHDHLPDSAPAHATAKSDQPQAKSPPLPLDAATFIESIADVNRKGSLARIPLPGGKVAAGTVTEVHHGDGTLAVSGTVSEPYSGSFYFLRQPLPNKSGPLVGHVLFDNQDLAYRVYPTGPTQAPELRAVAADDVICRNFAKPEASLGNHPTGANAPMAPGQNNIPPLQSLPGAQGVIYLDFDGESGSFSNWNNGNPITVEPADMDESVITETWQRVSEDFLPFNINITTIRSVFEAAPVTSRMHCIITPSRDWYTSDQSIQGVAYVGTFNNNDLKKACWIFNTYLSCAETVSHELGHTLGLSHDGTTNAEYYGGHGSGAFTWGPIMGNGNNQKLNQWSKGEYANANNHQDDLAIISTNNNNVDYRIDAAGDQYATAATLDIASGGGVATGSGYNEGIIETPEDADAFKFTVVGSSGNLSLNIKPAEEGPNLDILAEIFSENGATPIASNGPATAGDGSLSASFTNLSLPAGNYYLRISGAGRGVVSGTGYSDYGSLGTYLISGTITGAVHADHFTIAENPANGDNVGTVNARVTTGTTSHAITAGNESGAFAMNSTTGKITVANAALLNFEALSAKWDDPASFELTVTITDSNGTITETLRTIVTVTDVNEAPVITPVAALTLPESTATATTVATVAATDPDYYDYITYAITGGNLDNAFSIDANTGVIKTTKALTGTSSVTLTVQVTDHRSPANSPATQIGITTQRALHLPANVGALLETNLTPTGGPFTYAWSKVSGPGTVNFATPAALTCATNFGAAGDYLLRLAINNGTTTAIDDIALTVHTPADTWNPSGINYGTVTGASYTSNNGTYTITGASAGIDDGGSSDNFQLYGQSFPGDFDLKTKVPSANIAGTFRVRTGLIVRADSNTNGVSVYIGHNNGSPNSLIHWVRRSTTGATNFEANPASLPASGGRWMRITRVGNTVISYYGSDGVNWSQSGSITLPGTVTAGLCWTSDSATSGTATFSNLSLTAAAAASSINLGALVNAGPDQTISSTTATLAASISDDGKPAATPTAGWVQVSGPGTVTFADASAANSAANSTATASQLGTYVLRWIGNDSEVKTFDDVQITFATPYDTWKNDRFGANTTNPTIAGDNADPDKDGRVNLLEYALNTNPNSSDTGGVTYDIVTYLDSEYLRMTVTKNPAATDLTYSFEVSNFPYGPWTEDVRVENSPPDKVTGRDETPMFWEPTRFMRLKVTRN